MTTDRYPASAFEPIKQKNNVHQPTIIRHKSYWHDIWLRFIANRKAVLCIACLFVLIALSVIIPIISSHQGYQVNEPQQPAVTRHQSPWRLCKHHLWTEQCWPQTLRHLHSSARAFIRHSQPRYFLSWSFPHKFSRQGELFYALKTSG